MDHLEKIIKGCLAGKREYQEKLYRVFSGKMYGLCLKYAGNEDDAKDIMQEGFIKVYTKLEQYNHKGSFEGWIRRIMINTALEKYRSQLHLKKVDEELADRKLPLENDILEEMEARELIRLIRELPPRYRMVFNLYVIDGYSHREIGEMMDISEGTSKSNLSRARTILKQKLVELYKTTRHIKS